MLAEIDRIAGEMADALRDPNLLEDALEMAALAVLSAERGDADTAKAATEVMCLELVNILAIQPELAGKANALAVGIQEATK